MPCGDWKWGNFKAHCSKEYRTGETCGMKLVWETFCLPDNCKYCTKIQTKKGKIAKEEDRIRRWKKEGSRFRASISQSEEIIEDCKREIRDLDNQRASVVYARKGY